MHDFAFLKPRDLESAVANFGDGNGAHPTDRGGRCYMVSGALAATLVLAQPVVVRRVQILNGSGTNAAALVLVDSANTTFTNKRRLRVGLSTGDGTNTADLLTGELHDLNLVFDDGLAVECLNGGTALASDGCCVLIWYDVAPDRIP